ncbi:MULTISPECIES: MFS transporter [unclassified Streptomyces]|uniref:MFS transporter n=1 Tax=unclassified Streptomyces TaxID=2593676 RepID=UPI00036F3AFB|nr:MULTISPECIES: MFS transporter [unclassified Streptomyces]MYT33822.1 MFS transporter [Streptomyces sp. SID8354]
MATTGTAGAGIDRRTSGSGRRPLRGPAAAAVVAVAFLITMLGATIPTPLYPLYEQRLGFGGLMVTVVFAIYAVGVAAALVLFGPLSDQVGRRTVLIPGLLLACLSGLVFLIPDSLPALLVGRMLSGLSTGVFTGTATAMLIDLAPARSQRRYGLAAAASNMLGLGLGPVFAGALAQYAPHPLQFPYAVHITLALLAAIALCFVPDPVRRGAGPVRLRVQRVSIPAEVRGTFVRATIAGFAGFAVLGLFNAVAPSFLAQELRITDHLLTGLIVFAFLGTSAVGQVASTALAERTALLTGCVALAAGAALVGLSFELRSLALLVTGAVVAGMGQGMSFRAGLATVTTVSPAERRGEVTSTFFLVLYIAISFPVIAVGLAVQTFGLIPTGVVFSALVTLTAAGAAATLCRQRP